MKHTQYRLRVSVLLSFGKSEEEGWEGRQLERNDKSDPKRTSGTHCGEYATVLKAVEIYLTR